MSKAVTLLNDVNKTSNFYPITPELWKLTELPIVASVAMEQGTALWIEISSNTTTGRLKKMWVENALGADFVGILAETIATTDADYATAGKLKSVWVPLSTKAEAEFKVWAWTFTAVDVWKTVEFHSDSISLAVDTAWKGARITKFISSTRGVCRFDQPNTETA